MMIKKILRWIKTIFVPANHSDSLVSVAIGVLIIVGLLFTTSASMSISSSAGSTLRSFIRQTVIIIVSIAIYNYTSNNYTREKAQKYAEPIALVIAAALIAAYIWCMAKGAINGNYSWIYIGPFSLQPSEFAKFAVILLVSTKLADKRFNGVNNIWEVIKVPFIYFAFYVGFIFIAQKDKGSAFVVGLIGVICFLIPSHKIFKKWQMLSIIGLIGIIFAYSFCLTQQGQDLLRNIGLNTIAARFEAVVNPSYYSDATREIFYSLLGISKGKLLGVGFGNSVQKFGYLVSSDADYIFSIIVEESGLIGIVLVFAPYFLLIARLFYYCKRVDSESDRVVLVGAIAYLFVHMVFNIGGVSGMLPLTGIPLLLLSRGGSASFSIMFVLGMCQGIINHYEVTKIQRKTQTL